MRVGEESAVDWADAVDVAAVLLYALSYNTPEAVAGMAGSEMAKTWAKLDGPTRHLYRRRARLVVRQLPTAAAA